jgi:hypothetical protein
MSSYSVFIPRVFSNIKDTRIVEIFHQHDIGQVRSVDLVSRKNQKGDTTQYYNMAFVHFETMYETPASESFRQDVANPDTTAKLVYEDPWFWLVLPFEQKDRTPTSHGPGQVMENNTAIGIENTFRSNVHAPEIVPQMTQFWVMTPNGPRWQWGYAHNPEPVAPNRVIQKMVPPQVLYGSHKRSIQRRGPKKRIDLEGMSSSSVYSELQNQRIVRTITTEVGCRGPRGTQGPQGPHGPHKEEGEC